MIIAGLYFIFSINAYETISSPLFTLMQIETVENILLFSYDTQYLNS